MRPTKKLIQLFMIGIVITAWATPFYMHKPVFFLYNGILFVLAVLDYRKSKPQFELTRDYEQKLSLFAEEEMGFIIYNKSDLSLQIQIKDTIPDFHFQRITEFAEGNIQPHEKKKITYRFLPRKRGIFYFTDLHISYLSNWGLLNKYVVQEVKAEIKVYPNIRDLKKYRLMVYGGYLMRGGKKVWHQRGEGLEYESLRDYVAGDSYNKINWGTTARQNKPIVNEYEVEKNQDVIMMIDSGRAMSYEVRGYKKLDLAINTALILSDIANITGDKSGLMVFNTEVQQYVKPGTGGVHRNKLLESLFTIDYSKATSNFTDAFSYLRHQHKKRSILFMFTEFETMDEAEEYIKVLPQLSRRHLVILFMMTKEKVVALGDQTSIKEEDVFLKGAALEILEERKLILSRLKRTGIMCVECLPDTLTTEVINHYIRLKKKNFS